MIRKYTEERAKDLAPDERVAEATITKTLRCGGEKATVVKGNKYIVSGNYDCFEMEKPKRVKKEPEENTEVQE